MRLHRGRSPSSVFDGARRLPVGALALLAASCLQFQPSRRLDQSVSPSPAGIWTGPLPSGVAAPAPPQPRTLGTPQAPMSLPALVDLALGNNPSTQTTWHQARAAAAELGVELSQYYPTIDLEGSVSKSQQAIGGGRLSFQQTTYGPTVTLSYLLLDLGGRSSSVDEAQLALAAANLSHNAAVENVILGVEQAYYQVQAAEALVAAQEASIREAQDNASAAEVRRKSGVATVFDVLQAQTVLSQAELTLRTLQGQAEIFRGQLATAAGVPAISSVTVGGLPARLDLEAGNEAVEMLVAEAEKQRPELAQARAAARQAEVHVGTVRATGLPTLSLSGNAGRSYFVNSPFAAYGDNYSLSLLLNIPLFTGMRDPYNVAQAEEAARAAQAQAKTVEEQVVFQVWQSYQSVRTAAQQVATAGDLLRNAQAANEVAIGRYRAGVGSILDVTTAQAALASARAQEVQARANWLLAAASLAHDTGALRPPAQPSEEARQPP